MNLDTRNPEGFHDEMLERPGVARKGMPVLAQKLARLRSVAGRRGRLWFQKKAIVAA